MPESIATLPYLLAQNAAGGGGNQGNASWIIYFYVAVIGLWFYVLWLRPQQKQDKKRKEMINTIKKNDRVVTASGMYGTVVSVDDSADKILLRVDDDKGVRIAFTRASIARVIDPTEGKEKDKPEKAKAETA